MSELPDNITDIGVVGALMGTFVWVLRTLLANGLKALNELTAAVSKLITKIDVLIEQNRAERKHP